MSVCGLSMELILLCSRRIRGDCNRTCGSVTFISISVVQVAEGRMKMDEGPAGSEWLGTVKSETNDRQGFLANPKQLPFCQRQL